MKTKVIWGVSDQQNKAVEEADLVFQTWLRNSYVLLFVNMEIVQTGPNFFRCVMHIIYEEVE